MLVDTVFDGLETQLNLKVDREKVIYLIMPYKGTAAPAVIRKIIDSKPEEVKFQMCSVLLLMVLLLVVVMYSGWWTKASISTTERRAGSEGEG